MLSAQVLALGYVPPVPGYMFLSETMFFGQVKKHGFGRSPIYGHIWFVYGPPWPFPGLQFNSLDLRESGLDTVSTNFWSFFCSPPQQTIVLGLSILLVCLGWPRNHHKKMRLEILHIPDSAACQTELVVKFYGHVNPFHPIKTV